MSRLDEQQRSMRRQRQDQAADNIKKREDREREGERRLAWQGVGASPNGIIFTNLALINF